MRVQDIRYSTTVFNAQMNLLCKLLGAMQCGFDTANIQKCIFLNLTLK